MKPATNIYPKESLCSPFSFPTIWLWSIPEDHSTTEISFEMGTTIGLCILHQACHHSEWDKQTVNEIKQTNGEQDKQTVNENTNSERDKTNS